MSRILITVGCDFPGSNLSSAPDNLLRYGVSIRR